MSIIDDIRGRFPIIHPADYYDLFPRLKVRAEPPLAKYTWEQWHEGFLGGGGLLLVDELARRMQLRPGMRVLDLACGLAPGSIYLAREYGVQVIAADKADPTQNWQRVQSAGVADLVTPIKVDARDIPLPPAYFDAIICLNSYFYFGTDDLYLLNLARYLRPGGWIGIASPCYRRELGSDTPVELLYDEPPYPESYSVHSPAWWRRLFTQFALFEPLECDEHPRGRDLWLDDVRRLLERYDPLKSSEPMRAMLLQSMVMMLSDGEHLNTYLTIVGRKRGSSAR